MTCEAMAAGDVYDNGRRATYGTMAAGDRRLWQQRDRRVTCMTMVEGGRV